MGSFIARQPNGLLCRFSEVVDTVTDYNMTEEEYIEMCAEKAREEARWIIQHRLRPYDWVKSHFAPINMTFQEFDTICQEMEKPNE